MKEVITFQNKSLKKDKVRGFKFPDFKIYNKAIAVTTMC